MKGVGSYTMQDLKQSLAALSERIHTIVVRL
jgi:hypothetical protein